MRVVHLLGAARCSSRRGTGRARSAFGDASVFLEKRPASGAASGSSNLADHHGNLLHLYERDCSVQRRHQKVVEVAPASNLPAGIRGELYDAAVSLHARRITAMPDSGVLYDVDSRKWYFIEVNPRIQVEHTVTEMVTGIDLVRSQLIAQGHQLHEPPLTLPIQESVPLNGTALQCRVTTKTRRTISPRLRENINLPFSRWFWDSAGWRYRVRRRDARCLLRLAACQSHGLGTNLPEACQRMDRALREFRIRGVKTNIPFVENVVNHRSFAREVTTFFLDESPELFRFPSRGDRATKLLSYIGDVILNGNPEVKGSRRPRGKFL